MPSADRLEKLEQGIENAIEDAKGSYGGRYLHLRLILRYIHRTLCGTGMRISEALYLTTDHVDFDDMTITVEGAVVEGEPGLTKTGKRLGSREAGTRIIPMTEQVAETIREWLELREEHDYPPEAECNTIFCRRDGSYYTDDQIRSYYKRACSKAKKMKGSITPHQLRHWFNDQLRKAGVSSEVREAMLGHADAETNAGYTSVKALEGRSVINDLI